MGPPGFDMMTNGVQWSWEIPGQSWTIEIGLDRLRSDLHLEIDAWDAIVQSCGCRPSA